MGKIGERVYTNSLKCFALNSPNQRFYVCLNNQLAHFDLICKALRSQTWKHEDEGFADGSKGLFYYIIIHVNICAGSVVLWCLIVQSAIVVGFRWCHMNEMQKSMQ